MNQLPAKPRRWQRITLLIAASITLGLLSIAAYVYYREKPRVQLIGQSLANIHSVLHEYIDEYNAMPNNIDDLVAAGLVARIPPCRPMGLNDERATTEYRLALSWNDHMLYYWNDIVINWGVSAHDFQVRDGILVNALTGKPDFIVGRHDLFDNNRTVADPLLSILLHEVLAKKQGTLTTTSASTAVADD